MRSLLVVCSSLAFLSACMSTPETKAEMPSPSASVGAAAKAEAPAKGPQCYSGDAGNFFNVGEQSSISGIQVSCDATSDGKGASWNSAKK